MLWGNNVMQLRDILYAVTVARELSFSKAAQQLYISQPALSQSIQRLERELGVDLFVREATGIRLTNAGKTFLSDGHEILSMAERMKEHIGQIANSTEAHLRFGISPFYSKHYLPKIIPMFHRQYPNVSLDIEEMPSVRLEEMVLQGEVEFCLMPLPTVGQALRCEILYQEQILFAIPQKHWLTNKLTMSLSDELPFVDLKHARNEPFLSLKKEQKFYEMGKRLCRNSGFEPKVIFSSMNWDTIHALIAEGMGVGFVPEILMNALAVHEHPVYCRIIDDNTTRPYGVIYRKDVGLSSAARQFIETTKTFFHNFRVSDFN